MIQGKGRVLATAALGLSMVTGAATTAFAQHVVTEDEASKLTLAALTAAPRPAYHPFYRTAYHAMYRAAMAVHFPHWRHHAGRAAVVQDVVYRHVVRHGTAHHAGRRYRG